MNRIEKDPESEEPDAGESEPAASGGKSLSSKVYEEWIENSEKTLWDCVYGEAAAKPSGEMC